MESYAEKYGFKQIVDAQGNPIEPDFQDDFEELQLRAFELVSLVLKEKNQPLYTMAELGSNHAYYSLLFRSILRDKNVWNVMVECNETNMARGQKHFDLNGYTGTWISKQLTSYEGKKHHVKMTCLDDLMEDQKIGYLDVLHADIDGAEYETLEGATKCLSDRKIGYLFLSTHSSNLHIDCLTLLRSYQYETIELKEYPDSCIVAYASNKVDHLKSKISDHFFQCRKINGYSS